MHVSSTLAELIYEEALEVLSQGWVRASDRRRWISCTAVVARKPNIPQLGNLHQIILGSQL